MNIWKTLDNLETYPMVTTGRNRNYSVSLPRGQVSKNEQTDYLTLIRGSLNFQKPGYEFDVIPTIRQMTRSNPDVSQAFKDIIRLANTGHEIIFDNGVSKDQQIKMLSDISEAAKSWSTGSAGLHGLINKMLAQALIGGAIACEWVPNPALTDIEKIKFLKPETIRFSLNKRGGEYVPYQKVGSNITPNFVRTKNLVDGQYIKLNPNTFKYYALLNDEDIPYGIPPYLSTITPASTQARMLENIQNVTDLMGVLGWAEARMEKPDPLDGESDESYESRLNQLLTNMKSRVEENLRTGVSVGFKEDHEFDFKSTVKDAGGMETLWNNNEEQMASALDFDSAFMGRSYGSDGLITILFTKMIAQLSNIQEIVECNLEYGLSLYLRLKGYNFKNLQIEFKKSTITDDLKHQQAQEIKLRNQVTLYKMGTIDEYQLAKAMGYAEPSQDKPRVDIEVIDGGTSSKDEGDRKDKEQRDDKSDRTSRDKKKPQGTKRTRPITSKP